MSEIYPHQPEDNDFLIQMGRLMLELQNRAQRMGMNEYIDIGPADPEHPEDGYHWDYWITNKRKLQ